MLINKLTLNLETDRDELESLPVLGWVRVRDRSTDAARFHGGRNRCNERCVSGVQSGERETERA